MYDCNYLRHLLNNSTLGFGLAQWQGGREPATEFKMSVESRTLAPESPIRSIYFDGIESRESRTSWERVATQWAPKWFRAWQSVPAYRKNAVVGQRMSLKEGKRQRKKCGTPLVCQRSCWNLIKWLHSIVTSPCSRFLFSSHVVGSRKRRKKEGKVFHKSRCCFWNKKIIPLSHQPCHEILACSKGNRLLCQQ